jgi:methyl-accepting chemotaxis protein
MDFLSRINIRKKFLLSLAPAVGGLLVLSAYLLISEWSVIRDMNRLNSIIEFAAYSSELIHELQKERGLSSGFLGSEGKSFRSELTSQRKDTDEKRRNLENFLSGFETESADMKRAIEKGVDALGRLDAMRASVDGLKIGGSDVVKYYTDTIAIFLDGILESDREVRSGEYSLKVIAFHAFLSMKENAGKERAILNNTFSRGGFGPGMQVAFFDVISRQNAYRELFYKAGGVEAESIFRANVKDEDEADVQRYRNIAISNEFDDKGVSAERWFDAATARIDLFFKAEKALSAALIEGAASEKRIALTIFITLVVLVTVLSVGSIIGGTRIGRNIVRRILDINVVLPEIARGNLTIEMAKDGEDEISSLKEDIGVLVKTQVGLIRRIVVAARSMEESSGHLTSSSEKMKSDIGALNEKSSTIAAAAEEMSQNLQNTASSVTEMSTTISEIARQAEEAVTVHRESGKLSNQAAEAARGMAASAEKVEAVIESISGIAKQTNLLALNASIEAAAAGEAGKGFAVVASEVKELAGRTSSDAQDVRDRVQEIQGNSKATTDSIGRVDTMIHKLNEITASIGSSIQEQSIASQEISKSIQQNLVAVDEVAREINTVGTIMDEEARRAQEMYEQARAMDALAREMLGHVASFQIKDE